MTRSLLAALALVTVPAARAVPVVPFTDAPTLAERATELVIADCRDPDILGGPKTDGLTLVEVDVVRALKGDRKAGRAKLATIGQPMEKGKRYLMAGFGGSVLGSDFVANGELAVVQVPAGFDLASLDGKKPCEQVQLVLDARRADVAHKLRQLNAERAKLDKAAAKKDGWVGEYTRVGGFEAPERGKHVALTKDGDGYRLGIKRYEGYAFIETRPGVLECKVLGTITRGSLTFDGREAVPVLTADLCYEQFYLLGPAPAKAVPK